MHMCMMQHIGCHAALLHIMHCILIDMLSILCMARSGIMMCITLLASGFIIGACMHSAYACALLTALAIVQVLSKCMSWKVEAP